MEIRSGGPDAIERRCLITLRLVNGIVLVEPTFFVIVAELLRDAVKTASIRAELVDCNNLVGIRPLLAVGAVTVGAVGLK